MPQSTHLLFKSPSSELVLGQMVGLLKAARKFSSLFPRDFPVNINPIIWHVKESSTLHNNQKAKTLRAAGKLVYHFAFGESPFPVPKLMQEEFAKHTDKNKYLPGQGLPELREAISKFFKE